VTSVVDGPSSPAVVAAPAELDLATAPEFRDRIDLAFTSGAAVVVADMGDTAFCDSSGLKVLVHAALRAQDNGQRFELRSPSPTLRRTVAIVGASALLGLADDQ
jgi:anti-sigma B factor antagonist